ncbi:hypothetical protein [Streptomyces chartreusis]|uniref:hypothetical protein n=1 Tax=Streptomyces chartreusis TaxID=1969 RepID=UPI00365F6904
MTVYALRHPDGRWLYHLPKPEAFGKPGFGSRAEVTGVYADGQPMQQLHADWWATDHEAERLTTTGQPSAKTTGYRLTDPSAESVRYPATLTVDEWNERRDRESDTLWTLYTNVHEEQPALEHVYEGPIVVLEGREPPTPDEPQWIAQLPHALTERPEYKHLFPGHIPGLDDYLTAKFKAMPYVDFVGSNFQGKPGVHVSLKVPYDEPRTQFKAHTGRRGQPLKSGYHVQVTVNRRLTLPIPSRVPGDTYEEALASWHQQIEYWTCAVKEASVAACSHCNGNGFVADGSEKYSESLYKAL